MRAKNNLMAWVVAASFCMAINAADYEQDEYFGNKSPGDVISFTVTPPGTVLTGNVTAAGGFVWIGGPAAWNGTIPGTYAGVHNGSFDGTWSKGGGGEGGNPLTWHLDTTAVVMNLTLDHNLWWFNGENPANYNITATLTAKGAEEGAYKWEVTAGKTKVDLNNGGADADIINANDDNTVTVKSTAASASAANVTNDVTITLTYKNKKYTIDLAVFAPDHLVHLNNVDNAHGNGYMTHIHYKIEDQFNQILPHNVPLNEKFTTGAISDFAGEDWPPSTEGWATVVPADWIDHVSAIGQGIPMPQNPQTPRGNIKVQHHSGDWYIGSLTTGSGVDIADTKWQFYRDHGRHE